MWEPRQSPTSVLMGAAHSRAGGPLGPHILSSPPGTAAPIDAINYTPKTGEIHQPGVLAPIHEQNYSLIPSGQVRGGMGMGAGVPSSGSQPVVPGQERLTGRYSPPPSMASGTQSPGQPPLRPTPYSTGPGPRSQPSGPQSAPFQQRGSMAGTAQGWGAGQEMGAGDDPTGGVDLSKVPQTLSDAEIQAELSASGGGDQSSQPAAPTPTPSAEPDVSPEEVAASTPKGFHVEPPPDQQKPGAIVYFVSDDGSIRIPQYVVTAPPDPATHQPHITKIDDKTRAAIMGQPPTSKSAQHLRLPNADGTYHVWIVDPTTGQPTQDLTPNGGAPMPAPKTATNPAAARNIQPGKTQTVGGYFIYTQQPDGSWKLDQQATNNLISIKAQSGSAAAAAIRAQTTLNTAKTWQVSTLSDGRTIAVDLNDPVKDDGTPNTVELGPADPTKNLYTAGNTVLQYDPNTRKFDPIYTAPSNYTFQTIGGKLMAIDPLDPTKQVEVGQDPYYDATQQSSIEQTRANTQQILENVAKGDMDIETARESLLKDVYSLTHPTSQITSKGYFVPSGGNLTVDYGGYGGKGKEEVSGGPLPQEATDLANEVRARLAALDQTRAQRAKDVSAPARAPQPNQPSQPSQPSQPDQPQQPQSATGALLDAGLAGVPGKDPNLMGQVQPPHNVTTAAGDIAQYDAGGQLTGIRYINTAPPHYGEPGYPGSEGYDAGDSLDVGLTPSEDTGGDDTPSDLNVLDSFGGAGQDSFMGRGLTPQMGRGSTGLPNLDDPLFRNAMQRRGNMGMGSGQGPTSPTPAPPGASLQGQTGGAPGQQGWTPPVPPQEVAGIGHRFGQQMDQGEPQHSGVDLQALEGTPTISPVDGVVERVEHNPAGLGLTVIVRGKDGSEHRLGHLSRTKAFPGMLVAQGQDLGSEVGSSGNTTGSHLHWGVRDPQGQPVDPTGSMPPQMQQMPPVPGTEMMGPPGGNGGAAQQGAGQVGAGGELEDLLDATKPIDVEKYRANPMATRRALSMWGGANLGRPSSVWQPLQEQYPSDPGYPGTGQEDWPQDPRGIDWTGLPHAGQPPDFGPVGYAPGSETPMQDMIRAIRNRLKILDQHIGGTGTGSGQDETDWQNAGWGPNVMGNLATNPKDRLGGQRQGMLDPFSRIMRPMEGPPPINENAAFGSGQAPMQGQGMASQSPDYQQGYQDGVAASKSPGTPPVFIPSMRQPIPSMSDQGQMGGGQDVDPELIKSILAKHRRSSELKNSVSPSIDLDTMDPNMPADLWGISPGTMGNSVIPPLGGGADTPEYDDEGNPIDPEEEDGIRYIPPEEQQSGRKPDLSGYRDVTHTYTRPQPPDPSQPPGRQDVNYQPLPWDDASQWPNMKPGDVTPPSNNMGIADQGPGATDIGANWTPKLPQPKPANEGELPAPPPLINTGPGPLPGGHIINQGEIGAPPPAINTGPGKQPDVAKIVSGPGEPYRGWHVSDYDRDRLKPGPQFRRGYYYMGEDPQSAAHGTVSGSGSIYDLDVHPDIKVLQDASWDDKNVGDVVEQRLAEAQQNGDYDQINTWERVKEAIKTGATPSWSHVETDGFRAALDELGMDAVRVDDEAGTSLAVRNPDKVLQIAARYPTWNPNNDPNAPYYGNVANWPLISPSTFPEPHRGEVIPPRAPVQENWTQGAQQLVLPDPRKEGGAGQDSVDSRWDMYEAKDTSGFWGPPGQPPIGSGGERGMGAGGVYVRSPDGSQHWDETAPDPNPNGGSVVQAGTEHNKGGGKVVDSGPGARQGGPSGPGGTGPPGSQARVGHLIELAGNPTFSSGTSGTLGLWSGAAPTASQSPYGMTFGAPSAAYANSVGATLSGGVTGTNYNNSGWTPVNTPSSVSPLAEIQKQVDPSNWNAGVLGTAYDPSKTFVTKPGVRTPQQLGLPGGGNEMGTGGEGGMGAGDVAGVSPDANAQYQTELQIAQIQAQQAHDAAQKTFDVGMAQVNANLAAESDRHAEAISQLMQQQAFHADDVALKQAEDAENTRHNQAMESLQQQATQMQQTLEQMREANSIQLEQMQEGAQIKLQQGDQAFKDWQARQANRMQILSSALNNPWLQKLTGLSPAPGVNEGATGGANLANLINQVQQPYDPNAPGGGGGGQVFAGQQGAPQISTPSWSQWQGWDPFQKAAYRTNIEALGPGVWNQVQSGLASDFSAQGGNPNITQMQAAAATPTQSIGQQMTAEAFGQTQPAWQANQQKQWSQAQAPNVKQNLSGIAA